MCTELRNEGYKYLPGARNDLPSKYCFRDVNNDGINELIVCGDKDGVLGVYYYDNDTKEISYEVTLCNNIYPYDYENYNVYLTEDNKLVEYAGHNDHTLVIDISTNPSKNIVNYSLKNNSYVDSAGGNPTLTNFTQVQDTVKSNYPEDTSVRWLDFDGSNCASAKSVDE